LVRSSGASPTSPLVGYLGKLRPRPAQIFSLNDFKCGSVLSDVAATLASDVRAVGFLSPPAGANHQNLAFHCC
jgi:hypothetical protein